MLVKVSATLLLRFTGSGKASLSSAGMEHVKREGEGAARGGEIPWFEMLNCS